MTEAMPTAMQVFWALDPLHRDHVRKQALRSLYPKGRLPAFKDVIDHDEHPALQAALRGWWHEGTTSETLLRTTRLLAKVSPLVQELTILACAEHCLKDSKSQALAQGVLDIRMAWVRGEVSDGARDTTVETLRGAFLGKPDVDLAVWAVSSEDTPDAIRTATWGLSTDEKTLVWDRIAGRVRVLFPDPARLNVRDALTRWEDSRQVA